MTRRHIVKDPQTAKDREILLSAEIVAERLAVSVRTVRRWIANGQLPAIRIGRCVRVSEHDLARLITQARI